MSIEITELPVPQGGIQPVSNSFTVAFQHFFKLSSHNHAVKKKKSDLSFMKNELLWALHHVINLLTPMTKTYSRIPGENKQTNPITTQFLLSTYITISMTI